MALLGRVRLQVEFSLDARPVKTVWVTADIGLYGPVVVPTRPVARGEVVSAADVTVDRLDLSQVGRGIVSDLGDVVGRISRSPLVPYSPIRRDQLESPAAVHRGDVVLLVAERGGLRITAPGEVRTDAGLGEQVRVLNRVSRKDVVGRVRDASTVAVEF
jgi:flagella basal body P-ring formation protein FlgA